MTTTRRNGATWCLVAVGAMVAAILVDWVWSAPADADPGSPPPLPCQLVEENGEPSYWDCVFQNIGVCRAVDYETGEPRSTLEGEEVTGLFCDDPLTRQEVRCRATAVDNDIPRGRVHCPLEADWSRPGWLPDDCDGISPGGRCVPTGYTPVRCRNERELLLDMHREVMVPVGAPQWWLDEIENESSDYRSGHVGRGETDELADRTKNLGAQGCSLALSPPRPETCYEINRQKDRLRDARDRGTISAEQEAELERLESMGIIINDDCWGTFPSDRYEVTWDARTKTSFDGWSDRFTGWVSSILFGFGKLAVQITLWLVRYAFTFDITEYSGSVASAAADLDRRLVHFAGHDFSLIMVAWLGLFTAAGFFALRGKLGRAGAEIVMSIVLAGLTWGLLGPMFQPVAGDGTAAPAYAPAGHMESFADLVYRSSLAPLLAAHGRSPDEALDQGDVERLLRDTQGLLHREFIEAPYFYINWGTEEFDPEPRSEGEPSCAEIQQNLLTVADKPKGWPARYLARHGCTEVAAYNSAMTPTRFAATVLVMLVALLVAAAVSLAAVTLLTAKFLIAVLFVALPVAAAAAILPGRGRRLAWWWVGTLVQLWLAALAMGAVVMLLLFALDSIHATTSGLTLAERWVGVLTGVAVIYVFRRRMVAGTQRIAGSLTNGLVAVTESAHRRIWSRPRPLAPGWGPDPEPVGAETWPGTGAGGSTGVGGRATSWAAARPRLDDLDEVDDAPAPVPVVSGGKPTGPGTTTGGVDLAAADRGMTKVGFMTRAAAFMTGHMGALVARDTLRAVGRRLGRAAGGPIRLTVQRRQESRKDFKSAAYRAGLNEYENIVGHNRAAMAAGRKLYRPGQGGNAVLKDFPTGDQMLRGTWKFRLGPAVRSIKRGRFGLYGGEPTVGRARYRFGKPHMIRGRDGEWRRIKPPPVRPLPRSLAADARKPNHRVIENARRQARRRPEGGFS